MRTLLFCQHKYSVYWAILACVLLSGCGKNVTVGLSGEMATPYHVQYNHSADIKPPAVYVRPTSAPAAPPTALFMPLRVTQSANNVQALSRNISRQIWQIWLSQRAFSTLEYDDSVVFYRPSDALALARRRNAQLLVGGSITHVMDGGTTGDSSLSLAIEIYDVATGALLWHIAQGGNFNKKQASDFFLMGVQARMPEDPLGVLIRTIGNDIGMEIYRWVYPHAKKGFFEGILPDSKTF